MKKPTPPPLPVLQFGASARHDRILLRCIASGTPCPFNCVKDGAPNCVHHVALRECPPAQQADDEL